LRALHRQRSLTNIESKSEAIKRKLQKQELRGIGYMNGEVNDDDLPPPSTYISHTMVVSILVASIPAGTI